VCDGTAAAQACTTDMVFVDLAWCGLPRLLRVTQGLRARLADTPVVVLLDRPEQVAQLLQAHIDADLLVAKSAAPTVVCRSVQRFLVRRPH
jgi:DNA-binding response OmpR family regulator